MLTFMIKTLTSKLDPYIVVNVRNRKRQFTSNNENNKSLEIDYRPFNGCDDSRWVTVTVTVRFSLWTKEDGIKHNDYLNTRKFTYFINR